MHTEESISTMKFADRAMKVTVKATVNEINPEDDKLVQKLRREVMHLKELLQMRRNKTQQDINLELLNLKEENSRLKEMNSTTEEVEKLKKENKNLRILLQDNQNLMIEFQSERQKWGDGDIPLQSNAFQSQEDFRETIQDIKAAQSLQENDGIRSIMDKENVQQNEAFEKDSNFFITEAESERQPEVFKKAIRPPLPSIIDVLSSSKARETVLSTAKKNPQDSSVKKPKMLMNYGYTEGKQNDPYVDTESKILNNAEGEFRARVTREMGLKEIHNAAQNLKDDMAQQNRCTICTLKLP